MCLIKVKIQAGNFLNGMADERADSSGGLGGPTVPVCAGRRPAPAPSHPRRRRHVRVTPGRQPARGQAGIVTSQRRFAAAACLRQRHQPDRRAHLRTFARSSILTGWLPPPYCLSP